MRFRRDTFYIITIILLLGLAGQFFYTYKYVPQKNRSVSVHYNQEKELNKEIIRLIRDADEYVYFAVYTFTRTDIKDALLAAQYRKLEVVGLMDKEQSENLKEQAAIAAELKASGITIFYQDHSSIMHLKTVVTDKAFASGSYNWTTSATNSNDEILEIGTDPDLKQKYQQVLEELFRRYSPLGQY